MILNAETFFNRLRSDGYDFFTGVPCSLLSAMFAKLENQDEAPYLASVREDAAVGLCAGAFMAGKKPVLLMQNSGLGYCLNAFTSLNLIYKIPTLVIMSWRGFGGKDAPEHVIMGDINDKLLETSGMPYEILTSENVDKAMARANRTIKKEAIPFTLLVKRGLFDEGH